MSDESSAGTVHKSVDEILEQYGDCNELHAYVLGVLPAESLDYEDWAKPLKLSGGQLCLRETGRYHDDVVFYTWEPKGMRAVRFDEYGNKTIPRDPQEAVRWLKDAMVAPDNLSPVPREKTPFEPLEAD